MLDCTIPPQAEFPYPSLLWSYRISLRLFLIVSSTLWFLASFIMAIGRSDNEW